MAPAGWKNKYRNWRGTADEMAQCLDAIQADVGLDDEVRPNARLIRHYVQEEALSKPDREGKQAIFGFRQLVQYLVARQLLQDHWPLAKAASFIKTSEFNDLESILPDGALPERIRQMVQKYRQADDNSTASMSLDAAKALVKRHQSDGGWQKREELMMERSAMLSASMAPRHETQEEEDEKEPHGHATVRRIRLAPWCYVYLDAIQIENLSAERIDRLADGLRRALLKEVIRKGKG